MLARNIHADDHIGIIRRDLLPFCKLSARLPKDPHGDRLDQPGLLRDRYKFIRRYESDIHPIPPKQGLKAYQLPIADRDYRLVVHRQFAAVKCMAKIVLESDLLQETESKLLRENRKPVLFLLSVVHRDISVAKDLFRRVVFGIARGNSDIYVDLDLVAAKGKGLSNILIYPTRHLLRFACGRKIAKHDREFVSSDAGDDIVRFEHPQEPLGSDRQHFVADRVTKHVVDLLKTPNVDEKDLERHCRVVLVVVDHLRKDTPEILSVGEAGQ